MKVVGVALLGTATPVGSIVSVEDSNPLTVEELLDRMFVDLQ